MPGFDHFDDDEPRPRSSRQSDEDFRRFREQLRNGERDINSTEALEEIIQFYFEHEHFEEALPFVERLLTFEPYNADAWQRKGMILNNLFRYEDALGCYDHALSLNPTDPEILWTVAPPSRRLSSTSWPTADALPTMVTIAA